jgi:hypothetical protein
VPPTCRCGARNGAASVHDSPIYGPSEQAGRRNSKPRSSTPNRHPCPPQQTRLRRVRSCSAALVKVCQPVFLIGLVRSQCPTCGWQIKISAFSGSAGWAARHGLACHGSIKHALFSNVPLKHCVTGAGGSARPRGSATASKKKKIDEKERPRGAGLTAYLTRWLPSSELHRPGDPLPSLASSRSRSRGDQESSPRLPDRPGGNTPLLPVSNTLPRDSA